MTTAYYYFAASLPLLTYLGKPSLSMADFLGTGQRLMRTEDYQILESLLAEEDVHTQNQSVQAWFQFNRQFRNNLSVYRAGKLNRQPDEFVRGDYYEDPLMQKYIQRAEKASDPLEAEKVIAKMFWQQLDDLSAGHYYDLESIIFYGLKLKILERFVKIQSPKGKEQYEQLKKIEFPEGVLNVSGS